MFQTYSHSASIIYYWSTMVYTVLVLDATANRETVVGSPTNYTILDEDMCPSTHGTKHLYEPVII